MKYCLTCQLEHQAAARFCKSCGGGLSEETVTVAHVKACPACGTAVKPDWVFCKSCAAPLSTTETAQFSRTANAPIIAPQSYEAVTSPAARPAARNKALLGAGAALLIVLLLGWYMLGVSVEIKPQPADARVFIDGNPIAARQPGESQTSVRLSRGEHSVRVERDGFESQSQTLSLGLTETSRVLELNLRQTTFAMTILTEPTNCRVLINGKEQGKTDNAGKLKLNLTAGEQLLTLQRDGYEEWSQSITLNSDQVVRATLVSIHTGVEETSSEDQVREALEGWAASIRSANIEEHMSYYANMLDTYYNLSAVSSDRVRGDRLKAFGKFSSLDIQISNVNVQVSVDGQSAVAIFDKLFDFRGEKHFSGSVQNELRFMMINGSWRITGEKELQVYNVSKE